MKYASLRFILKLDGIYIHIPDNSNQWEEEEIDEYGADFYFSFDDYEINQQYGDDDGKAILILQLGTDGEFSIPDTNTAGDGVMQELFSIIADAEEIASDFNLPTEYNELLELKKQLDKKS
jgi:hypothetical protein